MTGLEERLRYCADHGIFAAVEAGMFPDYDEAADAITRLRGYAGHKLGCKSRARSNLPCTCGLDALLAELGEG